MRDLRPKPHPSGLNQPRRLPLAGAVEYGRHRARSGRHWHILFEHSKVRGAEVRVGRDRRQAGRRRRQYLAARGGRQRYALALKIGEEKQFVLEDGTAKRGAVAVAVKARVRRKALKHERIVHCIQVAIPEIFVQRTVEGVRPAPDGGVELPARGVAKLGVELVGQNEKFSTASFGTVIRLPVTALLLLSTPSTVKLLLYGR